MRLVELLLHLLARPDRLELVVRQHNGAILDHSLEFVIRHILPRPSSCQLTNDGPRGELLDGAEAVLRLLPSEKNRVHDGVWLGPVDCGKFNQRSAFVWKVTALVAGHEETLLIVCRELAIVSGIAANGRLVVRGNVVVVVGQGRGVVHFRRTEIVNVGC